MNSEQKEKKPFSVKEFFKSTAFKCIAVLLIIVLVSGILLTFCNALFAVSPEEELDRVLGQIYPDGNVEEIIYNEDNPTEYTIEFSKGNIEAAYKMDDDNYLISAFGTGGYGGTVTCWIVVEMNGNTAISGVGKVVVSGSQGETYLNNIPEEAFEYYSKNYADGEEFNVTDLVNEGLTGKATMSLTAITNSVNTALEFVRTQMLGEAVGPDPYENFSYTDYIDTKQTTYTIADGVITYDLWTTAYGNPGAGAFHIIITVGADKTITSYSIEYNGSTDGYEAGMSDQIYDPDGEDGLLFIGHNAEEIRAMFVETPTGSEGEFVKDDLVDDTLASGATNPGNSTNAGYSNFLCTYAALYATTSYDAYLAYNDYMQSLLFSEIYGESINAEAVDLSGLTTAVGNGTVNSVYSVAGTTDYILNVTALSNFPSAGAGSVTCWVVVETENGAVSGIKNVVIASHEGQSFIDAGMIKDEALSHFTDIFDGSDFTIDDWKSESLTGGATYSTTAIVDAVNSAMNFVKANLTGGAGE